MSYTMCFVRGVCALAALCASACLPPTIPFVPIDRATPTDALVRACGAGQGPACVVAGLRFLREAPKEPARRIGALKLFERGCVLGRGDACHAAGLLAPVIDAAILHHRACELGVQSGCERNEDLRGRAARACEAALIAPDRGLLVPSAGFVAPQALPAPPLPYPLDARAAGFEGAVKLCVRVSPRGIVTSIEVLDDIAVLGEAARALASLWRFPPVMWLGVPHGFVTTRTVDYRLE